MCVSVCYHFTSFYHIQSNLITPHHSVGDGAEFPVVFAAGDASLRAEDSVCPAEVLFVPSCLSECRHC
jgi:hypothetical protein